MGLFTKAANAIIARGLGLQDQRLYHWFAGEPSDSGESVSVETSMQLDVVWACVKLIAETIATLPLHLYRRGSDGFGVIADDHPLYRVLHDKPNADMTAVEYWTAKVGAKLLWGNGFSAIERGAQGRVVSIVPMRPDRVTIRPNSDGSRTFVYSYGGVVNEFAEDDIFHVKNFSLDGYWGLSPIAQARQTLGSARAAERASASIFRNGMRPSGLLTSPTYLTVDQRTQAKAMIEGFRGAVNTGGVPLIEGGWDFKSLSIPPEDAQLLQTRTFNVEQICRWYGVPPIMVGHSGQTTWGSGIEQIVLGWLALSLRSELKRIEQAINKSLLTSAEQVTMYAEFNFDGLLRADSQARSTLYSSAVQNGWMSRDEVRGLENLPKLPGGKGGDKFTVQSNLMPIEDLGLVSRLPREKPIVAGESIVANPQQPSTGTNIPG